MPRQQGRTGPVHRRRSATFVTLVIAALLVPVAIAFACNPQAHVSLDKTAYQPGSAMTVNGSFFSPNSAVTVSGPGGSVPVTTSSGGGFSVQLTAPATPGDFTVTASKPTGGFAAVGFSVAAPAPVPVAPAEPAATPAPAPVAQAAQPSFKTPQVARSQGTASSAPRSPSRSTTPARSPSNRSTANRSTANRSTAGSSSPATSGTTSVAGQTVFAGSAPAAAPARSFASTAPAARPQRSAATPRPAASASVPAQQAALSDLFSNYQPGRTASLTSRASGAPAGGASSGLGFGIGLLAFGLISLVAGLTAAEVRRRRPV